VGTLEFDGIAFPAKAESPHTLATAFPKGDLLRYRGSACSHLQTDGISPRDYIIDALKAILTKKPVLMSWEWLPAGLMENVLGTD